MPRKSTDETYQNSSKLETIDFIRHVRTEHETLRKTPPLLYFQCIFRSVTLLLKARASTSSIFDEKFLIGLIISIQVSFWFVS